MRLEIFGVSDNTPTEGWLADPPLPQKKTRRRASTDANGDRTPKRESERQANNGGKSSPRKRVETHINNKPTPNTDRDRQAKLLEDMRHS